MNKQTKFLLLFGMGIATLVYAMTTPVTQIYFMSRISPQFLAFVNTIGLITTASVTTLFVKESVRKWLHKWFNHIVVLDVVGLFVVNYIGVDHIEVRFIGMTTLANVTAILCNMLLRDTINQVISGDDLTNWNSTYQSIVLWAGVVGAGLGMVLPQIPVEIGLGAQCVSVLIIGCCNVKAYSILTKKNNSVDTEEICGDLVVEK